MKTPEDTLHFAHQRLRQREATTGGLHLGRQRNRITRRIAMELGRGETEVIPHPGETVVVRCASGTLWITQDGDPRDIILWPQESFRADRNGTMHVFGLDTCVIEIEFEDDADVLH